MGHVPSTRPAWLVPSRSDLLLAVTWFVLGTLFYATELQVLLSGNAQPAPLGQRLAVLAVACLAVLERRRAPLLSLGIAVPAVVVDGAMNPSLPVMLVLAEAIHNAVRHGSRQVSRGVKAGAVVTVILVTVGAGIATADWRITPPVLLQTGTVLLLPVWWAAEVRRYHELAEAERNSAAQQARIAELDRRAAISAERTRMARDLHDVIAGHLSAIALQSEAVLSMADQDPATARAVLTSVRQNSVQALAEMKAMIDLLRAEQPDPPDPHTSPAGLAVLPWLLDSARAAGLQVSGRSEFTEELPTAVDLTVYRIVQEALTNAVKHAAGSHVSVAVRRDSAVVVVEVINNLTAPAADRRTAAEGTGLPSMRERAAVLGGTLSAGLAAGRWRVRAVLPTGGSAG
jgi:signal transduction histidine kinase